MEDLSLHILDIAENSIAAQAKKIEISILEDQTADLLKIEIIDNGEGMDKETLKKALDPFFTTRKTRRFGFGLSLLEQAASAANGSFFIQSQPGKGTHTTASFQAGHIDTKPLGDISQTISTLIMGHPEIRFIYTHRYNNEEYRLDTEEIKDQLEEIPLNSPDVIKTIRKNIKDSIDKLRRKK